MEGVKFNIDPSTFTGSAVVIGFLLLQGLSINEQGSVGNWLQLVGLVMQTYSSQVTTLGGTGEEDTNDNIDLSTIKDAVKKMEEKLNEISNQN